MLLEVIVQTVEDARAATRGGADRLEIVRNIGAGGLTPPIALVRAIAAETSLPLRVMIRENAGFETNADEIRRMRAAIDELSSVGVEGIVIGFARRGMLAVEDMTAVLEGKENVQATLHRAFDSLDDPLAAIDAVAKIPHVDRILTSGGACGPAARVQRLRACVEHAGSRLTIMAGGGVDERCLSLFAASRVVREVHVGRAARIGDDPNGVVSVDRVRHLKQLTETGV